MTTIICVLLGAVLGTRYKVLCLVPIIVFSTTALVVLDRLNEVPFSSTALTAFALIVALQIGYLLGAIARSALHAASSPTGLQHLRDRPARIS
jgi:hypothetical protein